MGVTIDELQEKTALEGNEQIEIDVDGISYKTKLSKLKDFLTTPSGDQMHYAYETAGAVWNASTKYWELNGLTDITNDEMRLIYSEAWLQSGDLPSCSFTQTSGRTNISKCVYSGWYGFNNVCSGCPNIEVFVLGKDGGNEDAILSNVYASFRNCPNLHTILGILNVPSVDAEYTFKNAPALRNVQIKGLSANASFAYSPLLSKESLLYMMDNCASNVSFTITLHPDVYDKCTRNDDTGHEGDWWVEIDEAIGYASEQKNTIITLASA